MLFNVKVIGLVLMSGLHGCFVSFYVYGIKHVSGL